MRLKLHKYWAVRKETKKHNITTSQNPFFRSPLSEERRENYWIRNSGDISRESEGWKQIESFNTELRPRQLAVKAAEVNTRNIANVYPRARQMRISFLLETGAEWSGNCTDQSRPV